MNTIVNYPVVDRRQRVTVVKLLLTAFLVLFSGTLVRAAEVIAEFDGLVSFVDSPASGVILGDSIHGRLRYDTVATADPITSEQVLYHNLQELTLDILHDGSILHTFSATGGTTMVLSSSSAYFFYATGTAGLEDDSLLGEPLESLSLILQNDNAVPGSTTELPLQISMAMFNPAISFIDVVVHDNTVIEASITSIRAVPEQTSGALAAVAVAAILIVGVRIRCGAGSILGSVARGLLDR